MNVENYLIKNAFQFYIMNYYFGIDNIYIPSICYERSKAVFPF